MDYLNEVNELYPARRTKKEKASFREYLVREAEKYGKYAEVQANGKHQNVIVGDPYNAKIFFTAHYDTPATSVVPNMMMPRNPVLCYLYHFAYPFVLAMLSLLLALVIKLTFSLETSVYLAIYLFIYLGAFYLCTMTFKNKNNKNDNTSGVATVLSLISQIESKDVAFVFFDNEERGLLGSKAFNKKYKSIISDKPVLNLDCVGFGDNILVISKKAAEELACHEILKRSLVSADGYNVEYFPAHGSVGSSDQKSFKCGIGIMSCKKSKRVGYYTPYIHTNRDTVADSRNVEFLTSGLVKFVKNID